MRRLILLTILIILVCTAVGAKLQRPAGDDDTDTRTAGETLLNASRDASIRLTERIVTRLGKYSDAIEDADMNATIQQDMLAIVEQTIEGVEAFIPRFESASSTQEVFELRQELRNYTIEQQKELRSYRRQNMQDVAQKAHEKIEELYRKLQRILATLKRVCPSQASNITQLEENLEDIEEGLDDLREAYGSGTPADELKEDVKDLKDLAVESAELALKIYDDCEGQMPDSPEDS